MGKGDKEKKGPTVQHPHFATQCCVLSLTLSPFLMTFGIISGLVSHLMPLFSPFVLSSLLYSQAWGRKP
jgi:hypothetical protein